MEKLRDSCSFGSVTHAEGCRGDIFEKFSNKPVLDSFVMEGVSCDKTNSGSVRRCAPLV
jgi:hypothetical protein